MEAAATEAAAAAAAELRLLRSLEQEHAELQQLLQQQNVAYAENVRSAAAEVAQLSATLLELQRAHRCVCANSHLFACRS